MKQKTNITRDFSYLDNAPIPVTIVEVKNNKNIEPEDFEVIYTNKALEHFSGYKKNQISTKEKRQKIWDKHKEYPNILRDIAYGGIKGELIEYHEKENKYIKIEYYQPQVGYAAFIISDITENHNLSIDTIMHYQKIEVILKNSVDYAFEIELNTLKISNEKYVKGKNNLINDNISIPKDWLKNKLITNEGAKNIEEAIKTLKSNKKEAIAEIELRENKDKPFKWFKFAFYNYTNPINEKPKIVVYAKNSHNEVIELKQMQEKTKKDQMTDIYNVEHAKEAIQTHLNNHPKQKNAFFIIDIDDFKCINDTFGHPCGDRVIKLIANTLKDSFNDSDIIFRLGGDEFGIFIPNLSKPNILKDICHLLATKIKEAAPELSVTISIGVSVNKKHNSNYKDYYKSADTTLYKVKEAGKQGFAITHF